MRCPRVRIGLPIALAAVVCALGPQGPTGASAQEPPPPSQLPRVPVVVPPGGSASAQRGGWQWLLNVADGTETWFLTRQQATRDGDVVTLWRRREFSSEHPPAAWPLSSYRSLAERVRVDCQARTVQVVEAIAYRSPDLTNPLGPPEAQSAAAQQPLPGSADARFVQRACELFEPHRMQPY